MKKLHLLAMAIGFGTLSAHAVSSIPTISFPELDIHNKHQEDVLGEKLGEAPRFAVPRVVDITPENKGSWMKAGDLYTWKLRVSATNAVSLNFAFTDFKMSENSTLSIYSADMSQRMRDFGFDDNNMHNELWTPVIMASDVIIELSAPADEVDQVRLNLTRVNQGYRTFAQTTEKSGSCNVDVVCGEGDEWRDEIDSVAVISTGGMRFCTGFMVNNTSNDKTPYFMTAAHCRVNARNAASLVTYWNYQAKTCGDRTRGDLSQFTTGAEFLAASGKSDFTIVKLIGEIKPEWNVAFAGFDARDLNSPGATAIHHPNTDEKSISFEYEPTTITTYLEEAVPGDGTHIRIEDWDVGTTEPGSSGSPLFNSERRVIGQLHGGYASCSSQTSDWYGRIYTSWEGDGTPDSRLKDWLDHAGTGDLITDTIR